MTSGSSQWLAAAQWALTRWETFPVDAAERPLVLVDSPVRVSQGFATGEAKLNFFAGNIDGPAPLPPGVHDVIVRAAGSSPPARVTSRHVVAITKVTADHIEVNTDRGFRELRAWRLSGPEIVEYVWIVDPPVVVASWPRPEQPSPPVHLAGTSHLLLEARLDKDRRTLIVAIIGGAEAEAQIRATVVETHAAVAIIPPSSPEPSVHAHAWATPVGKRKLITVTLAEPLGNRVLVDLDGSPCTVSDDY